MVAQNEHSTLSVYQRTKADVKRTADPGLNAPLEGLGSFLMAVLTGLCAGAEALCKHWIVVKESLLKR